MSKHKPEPGDVYRRTFTDKDYPTDYVMVIDKAGDLEVIFITYQFKVDREVDVFKSFDTGIKVVEKDNCEFLFSMKWIIPLIKDLPEGDRA